MGPGYTAFFVPHVANIPGLASGDLSVDVCSLGSVSACVIKVKPTSIGMLRSCQVHRTGNFWRTLPKYRNFQELLRHRVPASSRVRSVFQASQVQQCPGVKVMRYSALQTCHCREEREQRLL